MGDRGATAARTGARSATPGTLGRLGIQEAAREVGVSPSALRLWERQGLLAPRRTPGGARRYGPEDMRRIREIRRLRTIEGLNAAAIMRWLSPRPSGEPLHDPGRDASLPGDPVRGDRASDGSLTADPLARPSVPGDAVASDDPMPGVDPMPGDRASDGSLTAELARRPGSAPPGDDWTATGARLRSMRRQRGLTLREAAARSGLSVSFVSAVERGASGASLIALRRLVEACGCTLAELLGDDAGRPVTRHLRPADRRVLDSGRGIRIENLALGSSSLEPQLFILQPGASSGGTYAHAGEEFMFVLRGEIRVWIGRDEAYHLSAGDALTYPSTIPHRFEALGESETHLIWVNTPPTF
jgi:DNA-binding transcriptional MerR regulator/transcriptional regulator with XRE-family HTH domain